MTLVCRAENPRISLYYNVSCITLLVLLNRSPKFFKNFCEQVLTLRILHRLLLADYESPHMIQGKNASLIEKLWAKN